MSNEVTLLIETALTLKSGKTLKAVQVETAMIVGGKHVMQQFFDWGMALALKKAMNGNYGAAVEVIGLAAEKAVFKVLSPDEGKAWSKEEVAALARKTLQRTYGAKGPNATHRKGRMMAEAVLKVFAAGGGQPVKPITVDNDAALENPQE